MDQMQPNVENNAQPGNSGGNNTLAIVSLVLGILSIVFSFVNIYVGLVLGIVGIVMGVKARKQAPSGIATGGFVCSIVGTALSAAMLVCALCALGTLASIGVAAAGAGV